MTTKLDALAARYSGSSLHYKLEDAAFISGAKTIIEMLRSKEAEEAHICGMVHHPLRCARWLEDVLSEEVK